MTAPLLSTNMGVKGGGGGGLQSYARGNNKDVESADEDNLLP